jgi:hypothetical protein
MIKVKGPWVVHSLPDDETTKDHTVVSNEEGTTGLAIAFLFSPELRHLEYLLLCQVTSLVSR